MGPEKNLKPVEEVRKLISIQSVTGNEKELAFYLEGRFRSLGCRTELFEAAPGRFNISAFFGGVESAKPGLLFHGHLDTVAAFKMQNPFRAEEIDGHIHGRGSVDQKGGIAAVIAAFEAVITSGAELEKPVVFIGVIDEESEHRGSMALKKMGIDAEYAVVTEPTGLKLGIGCKGTAPIRIQVDGKAAHGCRPWLGINAIEIAMDIVRDILSEDLNECEIEGIGRVKASWNLGKIEGGSAYNNVADSCSLWFDRRLVPGETQDNVKEQVGRIIEKYRRDSVHITAEIARPDWDWEPIRERGLLPALTDRSSGIVESMRESHMKVENRDPLVFFTDGYQEMDFLVNDLGIESIQYGPGDSSLCHTDNERLSISDLSTCTEVFTDLILRICG